MTELKRLGNEKAIGRRRAGHEQGSIFWGEGFSREQLRKLARDVDPRHVHSREIEGRQLSYIEGWYAIAQANGVFGYAGWDREMVHFEQVMERTRNEAITCAYLARVRIRVRAGSTEIVREGTGWGSASGCTSTATHERALKAAETDATKRALSTFGPRFGLSLYDKEHASKPRLRFSLFTPDGRTLDDDLSAEGYCTGLRQLVELCRDRQEVDRLQRYNASPLAELRIKVPALRNAQGTHFSDLLLRLMQRRREGLTAAASRPSQPSDNSESRTDAANRDQRANGLDHRSSVRAPEPGEAFRRYTGQSGRRRSPYPFPPRTEVGGSRPAKQLPAPRAAAAGSSSGRTGEAKATAIGAIGAGESATGPKDGLRKASTAALPIGQTADAEKLGEVQPPVLSQEKAVGVESQDQVITPGPSPEILPPSRIAHGARIDKSKLLLSLERRLRDKEHLKRVGQLPCLVCNRQPSHAHHLRFAQKRGMSQKVSDEYVVPLCALHHGELHQSSSETDWWKRQKIDPLPISSQLWTKNHSAGG